MLVTMTTIIYKSFRMMSSVDIVMYFRRVAHECVAYSFDLNTAIVLHDVSVAPRDGSQ